LQILNLGKLYPRFDLCSECPYNKLANFELENITITKFGVHDFFINGLVHVYKAVDISKVRSLTQML